MNAQWALSEDHKDVAVKGIYTFYVNYFLVSYFKVKINFVLFLSVLWTISNQYFYLHYDEVMDRMEIKWLLTSKNLGWRCLLSAKKDFRLYAHCALISWSLSKIVMTLIIMRFTNKFSHTMCEIHPNFSATSLNLAG